MKQITLLLLLLSLFNKTYTQEDPFADLMSDPELKPAIEMLTIGQLDSSLTLLNEFDSTHSKYFEIMMFKSQLFWETKDFDNLKKVLNYIIPRFDKDDPNYSNMANIYGLSYKYSGDLQRASEIFDSSYTSTGDLLLVYNLARTFNDMKEYNKTIKLTKHLRNDTLGELYFSIGEAQFQMKNFSKSKELLEKYFELNEKKSNAYSHYIIGMINSIESDLTSACQHFNASKRILEQTESTREFSNSEIELFKKIKKELIECNK
jgi:tetratricopeptide (TPR) repeat protein